MSLPKTVTNQIESIGATVEIYNNSNGFDYFIDAPEGYEFNATLSGSICGSFYKHQETIAECIDRITADINKGIYKI